MEELMELRGRIERGEYDKALELVAEMEEMSRDDKIN
jgi:pentatricopeptide repeat protein